MNKVATTTDADTEEVQRVPAHTKPHYWIAVRGHEVWNRWAREGLSEEWFAAQRKRIQDLKGLEETRKQELLQRIDNFDKLKSKPLTQNEKDKILADIQTHCKDKYHIPHTQEKIDFRAITIDTHLWKNKRKINDLPFIKYIFVGWVDFSYSQFETATGMQNILFFNSIEFSNVNFIGKLFFNNAHFFGCVYFDNAIFQNDVDFDNSTFYMNVDFEKIKFHKLANFYKNSFFEEANFNHSLFNEDINFKEVKFFNKSIFNYSEFLKTANFQNATFHHVPSFIGATCEGVWRFSKDDAHWPQLKQNNDENWEVIATDYAQLRKRMEELKLHDHELFFHGKELQARSYDCLTYKDKDKRKYWLGRLYQLYGFSCHYGQSVFKPSLLILATITIFFCLYWVFIIGYSDFPAHSLPPVSYAGYLAWHNAFSFLPTDTATHAQLFNLKAICDGAEAAAEFKTPLNNHLCGTWFAALSGIQKLLSMLCWFLVALALRNRLRMR